MPERQVKARQYMIDLQKWRSVLALLACGITLVCSVFAFNLSFVKYVRNEWALSRFFCYFTTLSNILTALASSFILPYAVNGIRRKRFVYPKWMSILHYAGTICTTLTMIFSLAFILPYDAEMALGGSNFYLHVVCPAAVLVSFLLVESGYIYTRKDNLLCLIPFFLYSIVYIIMVVFVGADNGGWEDLYKIVTFAPVYFSLPAMYAFAYLVAFGIRKLAGFLTVRRQKRMLFSWKDDLAPVEIKIELYGLGRFYGLRGDKNDLSVPYDILEALSARYAIPCGDLMKAYAKGLYDGARDKSLKNA